MFNRHFVLALLVVLLICAGAGLAWHLGDYARPVPAETGVTESTIVTSLPDHLFAPEESNDPSPPTPAPPTTQPELSEPSLVGLPFELSPSVRTNCQRWEGDCKDMDAFLERMKAEPRNAGWARAMEARIEKAVMSGERGKFRIRALECRSTRCALEVASEVESSGVQFDADPALAMDMTERRGYFARENDPQTGITTLVSAQVWQTTETFEIEDDAGE